MKKFEEIFEYEIDTTDQKTFFYKRKTVRLIIQKVLVVIK